MSVHPYETAGGPRFRVRWRDHNGKIGGGFGATKLSHLIAEPILIDQFNASLRRGDLGRNRAHLSKLFTDSFALRTFPTHDGFRTAVGQICDLVRDQVFEDGPVAIDPEQRLLRIVALLRLAVDEREAVP